MILAFLFAVLLCVFVLIGGVIAYYVIDGIMTLIYDIIERMRR